MSQAFQWWANRKSRMGMKPSAKAPPHVHGRPWWTSPPVACPQPEHIEYVAEYARQVMLKKPSNSRDQMMKHLADWMKIAKRYLHEEMQAPERADLHTTEGLIIAACGAMYKMRSRIYHLGGVVDDDIVQIINAMQGRAAKHRRERATEHGARPTTRMA